MTGRNIEGEKVTSKVCCVCLLCVWLTLLQKLGQDPEKLKERIELRVSMWGGRSPHKQKAAVA